SSWLQWDAGKRPGARDGAGVYTNPPRRPACAPPNRCPVVLDQLPTGSAAAHTFSRSPPMAEPSAPAADPAIDASARFRGVRFLQSAAMLADCPPDTGAE